MERKLRKVLSGAWSESLKLPDCRLVYNPNKHKNAYNGDNSCVKFNELPFFSLAVAFFSVLFYVRAL